MKLIKFDENSIKNLKNLNELINKLFDLTIKSVDNIHENKKIEYMTIVEKIKYMKNNLFQENYMNTLTGKISVSLGFNFIFILSNYEKIYLNLEKMIAVLKKELNLKNKSFEHRKDYDILLIKHKNSMKTNSTSRNHLSSESDSKKDIITNDKLNKSFN